MMFGLTELSIKNIIVQIGCCTECTVKHNIIYYSQIQHCMSLQAKIIYCPSFVIKSRQLKLILVRPTVRFV